LYPPRTPVGTPSKGSWSKLFTCAPCKVTVIFIYGKAACALTQINFAFFTKRE